MAKKHRSQVGGGMRHPILSQVDFILSMWDLLERVEVNVNRNGSSGHHFQEGKIQKGLCWIWFRRFLPISQTLSLLPPCVTHRHQPLFGQSPAIDKPKQSPFFGPDATYL